MRICAAIVAMFVVTTGPVQALEPIPFENRPEICRQLNELTKTAKGFANERLKRDNVSSRARRLYKQLYDQMALLAFGWDTVHPFKGDDLDEFAIAASNTMSMPYAETRLSWAKHMMGEASALASKYKCK